MTDVSLDMVMGEIKALRVQQAADAERGDERHDQRMNWQKGHDALHVSLAEDLRELKTDVDKGKGTIVGFAAACSAVVAITGIIGGFWTYLTKTGQL